MIVLIEAIESNGYNVINTSRSSASGTMVTNDIMAHGAPWMHHPKREAAYVKDNFFSTGTHICRLPEVRALPSRSYLTSYTLIPDIRGKAEACQLPCEAGARRSICGTHSWLL